MKELNLKEVRFVGGDTVKLSKSSQGLETAYQDWDFKEGTPPEGNDEYLKTFTTHPWVFSAVRMISQSAAKIPMNLYEWRKENDTAVPKMIQDHPIIDLFEKPNEFYSGFDLIEGTFVCLELTGNAYWEIVYENPKTYTGKIVEMYLLRPEWMKVIPSKTRLVEKYIYGKAGTKIFNPKQIVHFKYYNPLNEIYGLATISPITAALVVDFYAQAYNKKFFKQGGKMSGVLETEKHLDDATFKRLKAQMENDYMGVDNVHKIPIFEAGLKYKDVSQSMKDIEFSNLRRLSRDETLGAFLVPPILVGLVEGANYANSYEQKRTFWQETMIPKLKKFANTINNKICPAFDSKIYYEHNLSVIEALAESDDTRTRLDIDSIRNGLLTINEVRERRGLKKVPWGETYYLPLNIMPYDKYMEQQNANSNPFAGFDSVDEPDTSAGDMRGGGVEDLSGTGNIGKRAKIKKIRVEKDLKKVLIWKNFIAKSSPFEKQLAYVIAPVFSKQKNEVIRRINAKVSKRGVIRKLDIDKLLFDLNGANFLLKNKTSKVLMSVIESFGIDAANEIGLGIDFDISNPNVIDYLDNKVFEFSKGINETTQDKLRNTLKEGYEAGEGIPELTERVEGIFKHLIGDDPSRMRAIARTEIISASNFGSLEGYRQSGIKKKGWLTAIDGRERDSHSEANGQEVDVDESFIVDGEELMVPGDPEGSPKNIVNCRCTIYPVID